MKQNNRFTYKYLIIIFFLLIVSACRYPGQSRGDSPPYNTSIPTVIVYGDSRTNNDIHQQIVQDMLLFNFLAVFNTGDMVVDGNDPQEWAIFNQITSALVQRAPYYPALGNHELDSPLYFENFTLPGNERWYSIDINNMHFIVLDSNSDLSLSSEQYAWLETRLQQLQDAEEWRIVIFHHPLFSTGRRGADQMGLKPSLLPLFEQYGVNLVLSGHDHDYERSLYNNIYFIVTGGGGAPLYTQQSSSPNSQIFVSVNHFCQLYTIRNTLVVKVIDINLNVIDSFSIVSTH
jgi:acid phosphatase type 7